MSEKTKFLEGGQESLGTLKTAPQWQSLSFFQFGLAPRFILRAMYFWTAQPSAG